jgi:hypothetical protein
MSKKERKMPRLPAMEEACDDDEIAVDGADDEASAETAFDFVCVDPSDEEGNLLPEYDAGEEVDE